MLTSRQIIAMMLVQVAASALPHEMEPHLLDPPVPLDLRLLIVLNVARFSGEGLWNDA